MNDRKKDLVQRMNQRIAADMARTAFGEARAHAQAAANLRAAGYSFANARARSALNLEIAFEYHNQARGV
jgi:hypothetical protein